ncbi:MAG TPA: hypothetical protein VE442_18330 [Jatrophihabitans sp.]|jgi:hypothetical protein|nr:hypothetical protein [Jatrophihabitans sp.]
MTNTVEITMTQRGYEVTAAGRTADFRRLEDAVGFARQRMERAQALRELKTRIDYSASPRR